MVNIFLWKKKKPTRLYNLTRIMDNVVTVDSNVIAKRVMWFEAGACRRNKGRALLPAGPFRH